MTIKIYKNEFKTKKELTEYARTFLKNNVESFISSGDNFIFLHELIKRHPRYKAKTKNGVKAFLPRYNFGGHIALDIIDKYNNAVSISFIKCATGNDSSLRTDRIAAMINAIKEQTVVFKKKNLTLPFVCPDCNETYHDSRLVHVDHDVIPFKDIASKFLLENIDHPLEFFNDETHFGTVFRSEDRYYKDQWCAFHKSKATLKLICGACNLVKK